jgi:hypothetical protein
VEIGENCEEFGANPKTNCKKYIWDGEYRIKVFFSCSRRLLE